MTTKLYPSDLSDAEWTLLQPLLPKPKRFGRKRTQNYRAIVNALFYLDRSGCPWRMLPKEYPPWGTVHWYYRSWRRNGVFSRWNRVLREKLRLQMGRDKKPSACIVDSQSVKTTEKGDPKATMQGRKFLEENVTSLQIPRDCFYV